MIKSNTLHVFTINFPFGKGEPFLYEEVLRLSTKFKKIYLFPMLDLDKHSCYTLPANVEIITFNIFQPYNRMRTIFNNITLIFEIYFKEIVKCKHRWKYFTGFTKELNNLSHKIAAAEKLNVHLKANNHKVEIAYTYWFNQWTFILSVLNKKAGKFKLFTRIHGSDVYEEQHTEKFFFFKFRVFQFEQITKVFAISSNGKQHLLKMNVGLDVEKVIISRLGVIDSGIGKEENGNYRIVSCSALQKYKRVHLIIDILSYIEEPVEWIHFGDGELKNEVLEYAKQLPLNINFRWMGYKDNASVLEFYKNNEIYLFVNVSETEGIPVSIMEAISFGIPAIATDVGGVAEIVNSQTGYLIPKQFNSKDVAKIISRHFNLAALQKSELRKNTRNFWLENYNADQNYNLLYKQMIANA